MQNYLGDWITKDGTEASITVIKNRIKGLQKKGRYYNQYACRHKDKKMC